MLNKLFVYTLNVPLFWLAKIFPKDKNTWVFGAWFGDKYADSSKYFFEYVLQETDVNAIWLSKNKNLVNALKDKGYKAHYTYGLKGYWYSIIASKGFIVTGTDDLNYFVQPKEIHNFWHGNPLKKIMKDDFVTRKEFGFIKSFVYRYIFPFVSTDFKNMRFYVSSTTESKNFMSAFDIDSHSISVKGIPRNDVFSYNSHLKKETLKIKKVLYMPTHRNQGDIDITSLLIDEKKQVNQMLKQLDLVLYVKVHYYFSKKMSNINLSNIKLIHDEDGSLDIYDNINDYDVLITDFSSIFFDFLLSEKPIIMAPFDYEHYMKNDRELYYDYKDVSPGPICLSWKEVINELEALCANPSQYKERSDFQLNRFHSLKPGVICQEILNEIS
jgi:CDP-glycerol glycerophosphotransferase (TagB/SpsB family)